MPSSYDDDLPATREELRATFRLVRLQIISPLSLLVSAGANVARIRYQNVELEPPVDCPGCPPAEISRAHPTLLTPLTSMIVSYWLVVYALQVGFCLLLVLARSEQMKDTLIRGVGMRFAIANWLQAAWAIFWTFGSRWSFLAAEICVLLNVINLATVIITLHMHKAPHSWLAYIFVHTPMRLFLAMLFLIDWLDNGFIVLGWENRDPATYARYSWQAVGIVAGCHLVGLIWVFLTRDAVWTIAAPYLLIALFLKPLKTTALEALFIAFVVLYPLVWLLSFALNRVRSREGRIRLEEEAVLATEDAHADRERESQRQQARIESRPPVDGAEAA